MRRAAIILIALAACTQDLGLDPQKFACVRANECVEDPVDAGTPDATTEDATPRPDAEPIDAGTRDATPTDTGPEVLALTSGVGHNCALISGGTVRCWGANTWGELGLGFTSVRESIWQTVPGLEDVVEVEAGSRHTCARRQNGDIRCWGKNILGSVGTSTAAGLISSPSDPIARNAIDLVAGRGQVTCAIFAGGDARCWGMTIDGQDWSGDDYGRFNSTPLPIPSFPTTRTLTALAVGTYHACAGFEGRELFCWGNNAHGQIGDGSIGNERPLPVPVAIDTPISLIALGDHESAAIVDTNLFVWGNWDPHMPGMSWTPNIAEVGLGIRHGCMRDRDGEIACWGLTEYGAAGYLPDGGWRVPAGPIEGLVHNPVKHLAAGAHHNCVLLETGEIWCWGHNDEGQLGRDTGAATSIPVAARVEF